MRPAMVSRERVMFYHDDNANSYTFSVTSKSCTDLHGLCCLMPTLPISISIFSDTCRTSLIGTMLYLNKPSKNDQFTTNSDNEYWKNGIEKLTAANIHWLKLSFRRKLFFIEISYGSGANLWHGLIWMYMHSVNKIKSCISVEPPWM